MSKPNPMRLETAQKLAKQIIAKLAPHCDRIDIAGSVRRKKDLCGDIELVMLPKIEMRSTALDTLFPDDLPKKPMRSHGFVNAVASIGNIEMGRPEDGRYVKIIWPVAKAQIDLFIPQAHDYWRMFAIRTGPSDYSAGVIATAWTKLGWCGTKDGLRLRAECEKVGDTWKCVWPTPVLPPAWESEEHFFNWLGLLMPEPQNRKLT